MQLDIESLRVLLAVLDHGGMTRAAERLHMSQSAVSRKVQRLEDRVGRPLLIRDGHTFRPTRDGRALLDDARAMVELHDRAAARLQRSDLSGEVRLASNGEIDSTQIAAILGAFRRRHPGANVDFTVNHSGDFDEWLENGKVDVALLQTT
ncbi:MAG: LysR family transcriptional regulator, partial [Actinomycetota bacterium]